MGPYGSVGAHIKTGRSPIAPDHLKTPPDKMAQKISKLVGVVLGLYYEGDSGWNLRFPLTAEVSISTKCQMS